MDFISVSRFFSQVSDCGIFGSEELAVLGNLQLFVNCGNGRELESSFRSWYVKNIGVS